MSTFVDTSAFYALLDEDDAHHEEAVAVWGRLREAQERVWTSNYVLVETTALVRSRLGMAAVRQLTDGLLLPVDVAWIDAALHGTAAAMHRTADRRGLSLVDCSSFEVMRRLGLRAVLAFDEHFAEQGFTCLR